MNIKSFSLPPIQAADKQQFVDTDNNYTLLFYLQNIERQFKFANNFGVAIDDNDQAETGAKAVYLRDLFVRPNLSQYYITPEQMVTEQGITELGIADLLAEHQRLFVLGDPGTGKSTLINSLMLAFSYYTDNLTKIAIGKRVPFPLILRDLHLQGVKNWDDLWQVFLNQNKNLLTEPLINDAEIVEQVFTSGQALIMLDGLDEITHSGQRQQLAAAVREAMTRYPRCLFLISSRVIGFNQAEWFGLPPEPKEHDMELKFSPRETRELLPSFYLSPFNLQQVQQFVSNWYALYVPKQVNHEQRLNDLKQCLQLDNGLGRLARIPVLLNMICFIHARRGRLPDGRAELYQRIAETYLVGLDKARGINFKGHELRFDYYDLSEWLGTIAYRLQERRTEDNSSLLISETEVQDIIKAGLAERGFTGEQAIEECQFILEYFTHRSGLFIPRDNGLYAFSHLSFLEYFAACDLKLQAPLFTTGDWRALSPRTAQSWWHETLALFFESIDNVKLADKYLQCLFCRKKPINDNALTQQQNLLADIVMDTSVRLPLSTRLQHIKILAAAYLKNPDKKSHLAFRLCSEHYNAIENLKTTETLSLNNTAFSHFTLLAQFTRLKELNLSNTRLHNLDSLQDLTDLQRLDLTNCPVSNLKPLTNLKQLRTLSMGNNTEILDISPLAELTGLTSLCLNETAIKDFSPLTRLEKLEFLNIAGTSINDLQVLQSLTKLKSLILNNKQITDLSPLAGLINLNFLAFGSTPITDLQPLANLANLESLWFSNAAITDLTPLAGLKLLKLLCISGTSANPDVLKHLPNLKIIQ